MDQVRLAIRLRELHLTNEEIATCLSIEAKEVATLLSDPVLMSTEAPSHPPLRNILRFDFDQAIHLLRRETFVGAVLRELTGLTPECMAVISGILWEEQDDDVRRLALAVMELRTASTAT